LILEKCRFISAVQSAASNVDVVGVVAFAWHEIFAEQQLPLSSISRILRVSFSSLGLLAISLAQ